jgi:DNA modification methylase
MFDDKIQNQVVTVLGKTFNSEEERRNYFREELRKKLPQLKQMEGFPIGEDEDILNLSDPPFYTACPNPWLNDFIAEWEEEKIELEKTGVRLANFEIDEPYASDISEGKSNPIYTAHTYHTKVPHPAIMRYLLYYTQPGDSVLDAFGGTGMTGVAAQICENPDTETKFKIELEWMQLFGKLPTWGKRKAICGDLSPYASFISYNYNTPADLEIVEKESENIFKDVLEQCSWLYETKHTDDGIGSINYTVWSDVFNCTNCGNEIIFWDASLDLEKKEVIDKIKCNICNNIDTKDNSNRVYTTYYDNIIKESISQVKYIPVLIVYTYKNKRFQKKPDNYDIGIIDKISSLDIPVWVPNYPMMNKGSQWGDTWRKGIHSGITHIHQFYTKRNLWALAILNQKIEASKLPNKLKFILTGLINRSTQMNRIHVKNFFFGGGGWNAGHLKGTLYIPSLPIETSILEQISDKINSFKKAIVLLSENYSNLQYVGSATNSTIKDNSIDYVFTDPPFGANIMYSELNFLPESWLKVLTNNKKEAIQNKTQGKSLLEYQELMAECFKEYNRVLKPGKWMTVEFSNTSAAVWNGIQTALQRAGFIIANVAAIDKKQGGMRSITTAVAVKQDLAISCYKPSNEFENKFRSNTSEKAIWDFVEEHMHHLPIHLLKENTTVAIIERSPRILFDRLISFYIQRNLPVPIDASKFQQELKERFIERDGMFFTNEQVQEYDKRKEEVPNFIQMNLFVTNEQDSIYWLRNILGQERNSEQDLHPLWMKEVASNMRKGDVLPEMRTILEENFLKDESGKWYVPDPENEADLDKLRNKRLLRLFDSYKAEALKPKGKLKEVRVEALRAGYKQCYQDKDFKTIVTIGDRIPNNLLMEDEVLLQFYDIAISRV